MSWDDTPDGDVWRQIVLLERAQSIFSERSETSKQLRFGDITSVKSEIEQDILNPLRFLPYNAHHAYFKANAPSSLYPWQAQCLDSPGVLDGGNLIYCAPTSGGKSLVAEILMLRRILSTGKPAIVVLPYNSLCAEKALHLRRFLGPLGYDVIDFYGGLQNNANPGSSPSIIVSTIEKANIL